MGPPGGAFTTVVVDVVLFSVGPNMVVSGQRVLLMWYGESECKY